jgi:PAS domain S-box-containing protein
VPIGAILSATQPGVRNVAVPTLADLGVGRLFDLVPDAVVVGDCASGLVFAWNPAAELMFGYPAAEAEGMPLERLVPPQLRDSHLAGLARYRSGDGGHLTGSRELVELPALHADGTQFWVELRLAPIDTPAEERRYVLAVFRDVTARHRAQEQARQAFAEVEAANGSLRDFLAMAAHDIRSPVSGVSMTLDLLARKWDGLSDQQRRELFDGARRHTTFVLGLLDDLIDVSSIESGALAPSPETCDVETLLEQSVELVGVEAAILVPPGLVLYADRGHVQRATANLLSNAEKYGSPPITVTARQVAGGVEISVADSGDGVPAELTPRMFDKFVRGHTTADVKPGAGLGLAIVAGLVKANGGDITYSRPPDGGSLFTCWWPTPGLPLPRPRQRRQQLQNGRAAGVEIGSGEG